MVWLVAGLCVFAWWAQRDAYQTGLAAGRLEAQRERSFETSERPRLRLIRGGK